MQLSTTTSRVQPLNNRPGAWPGDRYASPSRTGHQARGRAGLARQHFDQPLRKLSILWLLAATLPIVMMNFLMSGLDPETTEAYPSQEAADTTTPAPERALKPLQLSISTAPRAESHSLPRR